MQSTHAGNAEQPQLQGAIQLLRVQEVLDNEELSAVVMELAQQYASYRRVKVNALHIACYLGLESVVRVLAAQGVAALTWAAPIGTPLQVACRL